MTSTTLANGLSASLARVFDPYLPEQAFCSLLIRLCQELTKANLCVVCRPQDGELEILAELGDGAVDETGVGVAAEAQAAAGVVTSLPWLAHRIPLQGGTGSLLLRLPAGGGAQQALAHERLSLVGQLAASARAHPDSVALAQVLAAVRGVADHQDGAVAGLSDCLSEVTGANFAALAWWDGARLTEPVISGQSPGATRAAKRVELEAQMADVGRKGMNLPDRTLAALPGREEGWVIFVDAPTRAPHIPVLTSALLARMALSAPPRQRLRRKLKRGAAVMLLLAAIGLIPLPDSAEAPATVTSERIRAITAPFSGRIAQIEVAEGAQVTANQTLLVRLETTEFDVELITARSEHSAALLAREAARAERDAGRLATLEIDIQRLRSRITFLETWIDAAEIRAPIDGVVISADLAELQGATVQQGQLLVRIADPGRLALDLAIPQDVIARTELGAEGVFRPDFDPGRRVEVVLTERSPALDQTDLLAAVRGVAVPAQDADVSGLRQGMTGVFATDRRVTFIGLSVWRRLRDAILLRLWL